MRYCPDGEFVPTLVTEYPGEWQQTQSGETARWEGGMMGKGYFNVRKLTDCFFQVEYYLPT